LLRTRHLDLDREGSAALRAWRADADVAGWTLFSPV
jgi:hypothetical protein